MRQPEARAFATAIRTPNSPSHCEVTAVVDSLLQETHATTCSSGLGNSPVSMARVRMGISVLALVLA